MKKIILSVVALIIFSGLSAQDCMSLFPTEKGAQLVTKTYNASNNKDVSTFTYTVMDSYDNVSGNMSDIAFKMTDGTNQVISQGMLLTSCENGNFRLKLESKASSPLVELLLAGNTELVANFLDYPNVLASGTLWDDVFNMEPGKFTIYTKEDKKDFITVEIHNRQFQRSEKVDTPAGEYDAYKITFTFSVYNNKDKKSKSFEGVEWFAPETGIVRTETYDKDKKRLSYSVLYQLTK